MVVNVNGAVLCPRTAATMFFAQCTASRKACCAVGVWGLPVLELGIHAQSPTAQTPGNPGTSNVLSTRTRPFSLLQGRVCNTVGGVTPAVQTSVCAARISPVDSSMP